MSNFQKEMDDWGFYGCLPKQAPNPSPPPETGNYQFGYENSNGGSTGVWGVPITSPTAAKAMAVKETAECKATKGGKVEAPDDDPDFSAGWTLCEHETGRFWFLIGGEWFGPYPDPFPV